LNNLTNITETPSATAVPTPSFSIVPWDENSPDALYIKTFSECLQQEAPLGCIHTAVEFPIERNVAFASLWCPSDEQTLADTLQVMTLELNVDGFDISLDNVYTTESHDDDMSCATSKAILLGWSVGEHHIRWTYTFAEDFDDGYGSYPAGSYSSDYQINVVDQTQAELEEIAASESEPVEPPDGTSTDILLQDDFSNPDSGWEVGEYNNGSVGYDSGHYFVIANNRGSTLWGLAYRTFSDVIIEVDTTQVSAPANDNNGYGVFCRVQADDDGYVFFISGDGYYSIQKTVDGHYEILVDWTSSDVIERGNAGNHLQVICDGPDLTLFVNGERLATATDSTYTTGDIAFAAVTYEEDSFTEIHFDNFVVREP